MANLRTQDFKVGVYHGKTLSETDEREYKIQRDLFLIGKVKLNFSKNNSVTVRIFVYEVPLEEGPTRGKCADLLGYDKDFNIYIFELKREGSSETLERVINQINDYAATIIGKLSQIEKEFKDAFLLESISFKKNKIKKIILAPRNYYNNNPTKNKTSIKKHLQSDVLFGYFGGITNGNETKLRKRGLEYVNINFQK